MEYYPLQTPWRYRYYVTHGHRNDVRGCYEAGSRKLQAKFLSHLRALASLDIHQWRAPLCKPLTGTGARLIEIRFKADNAQQRRLGFRSGDSEFTLLFWAREIGDRFVPAGALTTALEWKARAREDRSLTDDLWVALF